MTGTTSKTPLPGLASDEEVLHRIVDKLANRFAGIFAAETVDRYVFESYAALARTSEVRNFLVPRTERFAADRLTALATAKGALEHSVPEVLFVCVQNSGRSQMAAALLKARAGDRVHVRSAGSAPAEQIDPHAVEVLRRRGLNLDEEFPKPLTDDVVRAADVIVTMGGGDSCPLYAGKRYSTGPSLTPPAAALRTPKPSPATSRPASTP
ncbi:arsenate reductase ArsC [Microlunatus lacustris]